MIDLAPEPDVLETIEEEVTEEISDVFCPFCFVFGCYSFTASF
jgi:hypothetical protein